jgi:hypothetical protein
MPPPKNRHQAGPFKNSHLSRALVLFARLAREICLWIFLASISAALIGIFFGADLYAEFKNGQNHLDVETKKINNTP